MISQVKSAEQLNRIPAPSPAAGDDGKGLVYDHETGQYVLVTPAPADAQKNSDITKAEIEAKLTGEISSHSHSNSERYEPLVNGDSTSPEIMFDDDGDIIMVEV